MRFFFHGNNNNLTNKTCHRDWIARLTAPCPSHKNFNVKTLHFANADADAGGSTIALPGLRPGELKRLYKNHDVLTEKHELTLRQSKVSPPTMKPIARRANLIL